MAAAAGCKSEVCASNPDALPVVGVEDDATVQSLDDVWQAFAAAIAPAELCVSAIEVWSVKEWRVDGRYRSVRRNIWIADGSEGEMATSLRHELCHAFDQQALGGRPPGEAFVIDQRFEGAHPGKIPAREAFAWTCSLDPARVPAYAAASCPDDVGNDAFTFVTDEVLQGAAVPTRIDVHRIDVPYPAGFPDLPILGLEAFVEVSGSVGILIDFDDATSASELAWVDPSTGTLGPAPPDGPITLLDLAPSATPPATGTLSNAYLTVESPRTQVSFVETALLEGFTQRLLVRRTRGSWGVAPESCGIALDGRTTFFLRGDERALTSISVGEDGLVWIRWDGTPE